MPPKAKHPKKTHTPAALEDLGYIREPGVLELLPIGATSFRRGVREGRYPAPVLVAPRTKAWRVVDIKNLLTQLASR
jgi:prophage regulatory protein